jgi:hypothetical protein
MPTRQQNEVHIAAMADQFAAILRDAEQLREACESFARHPLAKRAILSVIDNTDPESVADYAAEAMEGIRAMAFNLKAFRSSISCDFHDWPQFHDAN